MDVKEILNKLNTICDLHENEAVKFVYENVLGKQLDSVSIPEAYDQIKQYEREGKTGFDCGWVRVEFFDKDFQTGLNKIIIQDEALSDYPNISATQNFMTNKKCIELQLPNYPMYVQSTTIKNMLNKFIIDIAKSQDTNFRKVETHVMNTYD